MLHINDIKFSNLDVLGLLISLDTSKGCGINSLSPKLFKFCAVPLLQIICHLFHTSISFSTIPIDWCTHCVVPVYKIGDKSSVSNYRPISLLCKVLETIVYNNYVRERSSNISLVSCPTDQHSNNYLHLQIKSLGEVGVVCIDFKKAFDSMSHNQTASTRNNWKSMENGLKHI